MDKYEKLIVNQKNLLSKYESKQKKLKSLMIDKENSYAELLENIDIDKSDKKEYEDIIDILKNHKMRVKNLWDKFLPKLELSGFILCILLLSLFFANFLLLPPFMYGIVGACMVLGSINLLVSFIPILKENRKYKFWNKCYSIREINEVLKSIEIEIKRNEFEAFDLEIDMCVISQQIEVLKSKINILNKEIAKVMEEKEKSLENDVVIDAINKDFEQNDLVLSLAKKNNK